MKKNDEHNPHNKHNEITDVETSCSSHCIQSFHDQCFHELNTCYSELLSFILLVGNNNKACLMLVLTVGSTCCVTKGEKRKSENGRYSRVAVTFFGGGGEGATFGNH